MNNKFLLIGLISLSTTIFGQTNQTNSTDGFVGINTETPKATLDIKSNTNDGNNVMRFSTIPSDITASSRDYVLFAGEKIDNGYNLRKISLTNLFKIISNQIPSVVKIATLNSTGQAITAATTEDTVISMNKLVTNTSTDDFSTTGGVVTIKKAGYYDVDFWVGFKGLPIYEGDILVTLQKKSSGEANFSNYKGAVVSRSTNSSTYSIGNGIGTALTFVGEFKANDQIRVIVNNYSGRDLETTAGSVSLTISKVK